MSYVVDGLWIAWVLLFCLGGWITHALLMMRTTRILRSLESMTHPEPSQWPCLSVIVPALNEQDTIEAAMQSLLAEDYPNLQILLINDRSTDQTGAIIDRMAAQDSRITPIHIHTLPEGWLGKVHALHQGMLQARGEWVLLTDADVHFRPGTLRKAVAFAIAEQRDFVTALPDIQTRSFWLQATAMALGELMGIAAKIWEIGQPHSQSFAGVGPFNLIRRSFFEHTPGFSWIKMEVSEDLGIGLMMQQAGARMAIFNGRNQLLWTWYPTLRDMFKGLEKNIFPLIGQYRYSTALTFSVLLWLTVLAPFAAFFPHGISWLWIVGAVALSLHFVYAYVYSRWLNFPVWAGIFLPVGKLILSVILLNSAWMCWRRNGVVWRGTLYPLAQLREGSRIRSSVLKQTKSTSKSTSKST